MGYTTDFEGAFTLDKPLTPEHKAYLLDFAGTRRMKRDPEMTARHEDPKRIAAGLPLGADAGYFVGSLLLAEKDDPFSCAGQTRSSDILDYNHPPMGQPGLWCQWVPNEEGTDIEWDGGEKFYNYVEWLRYLILNFLAPWGYTLNGDVEWQGEDRDDRGQIVVTDNVVTIKRGRVVYK